MLLSFNTVQGIVLWEIMEQTLPYQDNAELAFFYIIREQVCNGLRPTVSANTPLEYRDLMQLCWVHSPDKRPSFATIVDKIESLLNHGFE